MEDKFLMTKDEYRDALEKGVGICRVCGVEVCDCEPDVINRRCEDCGAREIYGVKALLNKGEIELE